MKLIKGERLIKILKPLLNDQLMIKEISVPRAIVATIIYLTIPYLINLIITLAMNRLGIQISLTIAVIQITAITSISTIFIVIILGNKLSDKEITKEREKSYVKKEDILCVFFLMLGFVLIREALLVGILTQFEGPISEETIEFVYDSLNSIQLFIVILLFLIQAILIAPIMEELFFRGILFNGFLKRYKGNTKKAVIYSSIVFGIAHMNIPQAINGMIAGAILACIYYYTGSIKLAVFAHFLNNLLVFLPLPNNILMKIVYLVVGLYLVYSGAEIFKKRKEIEEY